MSTRTQKARDLGIQLSDAWENLYGEICWVSGELSPDFNPYGTRMAIEKVQWLKSRLETFVSKLSQMEDEAYELLEAKEATND